MKTLLFCMAAASALAAGCATEQPSTSTEPVAQREYPTGSNIPRKKSGDSADGVSAYDREALEKARDAQYQTPRPGLGKGGP